MMKSFEQRKYEIRRRSEERIAKRRRRVKALVGTAVCLLCVMGVAGFRPQNENYNASAYGAGFDYADIESESASIRKESSLESPEEGSPEIYREELTSLEDQQISLQVTNIDTEEAVLTMALTNYTNQQITYSSHIDIEYETENGWVSCAQTQMSWDAALYILAPEDTVTQDCWVGGFDLSQPGTYRLVKYCILYIEEDSTPCRVVTEFTVEEEP